VSIAYAFASEGGNAQIEKNVLRENCVEYKIAYQKSNSLLRPIIHYWRAKTAYRKLFETIKRERSRVTAIQLNVIFPMAVLLPLAKRFFNVPYTIVEHWSGYLPEDGNYKGFLKEHFTQKAVYNAHTIFHVSEPMKIAMQAHGLNGNYQLLYNVVDTEIFKRGVKQKKPLLVHVSSLVEREKNSSGLLTIISDLQKRNVDFDTIVIGGNGEELENAKKKSDDLNLTCILFLGHLKQEQIATYLQKAWAFVLPSYFEGMPVVALEALACGVPVFASPVGHLPYLINESNGYLSKDVNELSNRLAVLFFEKIQYKSEAISDFISKQVSYESVGKKLYETYQSM
jgi:glycosyltransferase involved in cell wall biosynthesis